MIYRQEPHERPSAVLASRLATQVVANALIALIVTIIGSQLHHLSLSAAQYGLIVVTSVIGGAVFLAIGQAVVGLVRSADTVNAASRLLLIALLFLGLFGQNSPFLMCVCYTHGPTEHLHAR